MDDSKFLLKVRYKFKDNSYYIMISITEQQYLNLLELPVIESCDIIGSTNQTTSEIEKTRFNERIKTACRNSQSHTKHLLR